MALSNGQRLGSFEVLAPIGAGGMGEVYRARDTRLGREVALKVLPESLASDRTRLSRFEQEARAASALNHPNIVTIHEIGREGDTTFIAMELVDGRTLRETTVSGAMPVRKALNVAAQISEGLAKAHTAGIVHRDLKPENVMVSKDGFVKILDFGLAKLAEPQSSEVSAMPTVATPQTSAGTVLGTVAYMSPEQASGESVDYRSDQFSLGSMLYEMATGRKAFQRKTAAETMSAIIREEPEPPGTVRPELPLPVLWVLERCLAKDRDERYASTKDLARDLAGLRDHLSEASSGRETLLAAPVRRRSRSAWIVGTLAVAILAGLGGWWAARARPAASATAPRFQRLSFQSGGLGNARFTPGGDVVYGLRPTGSLTGARLYLTRLGSPESKPYDFDGDVFSVSKSGDLAIFQMLKTGGVSGTLSVVPLIGGAPRRLVENVVWAGADWDPDGKDLAIVREVGDVHRLEFPIGKVLVPRGIQGGARFSPDGSEISYWTENDGIGIVDRQGRSARLVSSGWISAAGTPCWSADARELWVTGSRKERMDSLWAVSRTGQVRPLIQVPGNLELYDVSRQGRVLMGHHTILRSLRALAPGRTTEADLSWLDSSWPSDLSRDGKTILITENGEGAGSGPSIYLRTTDGAPAVRIGDGTALALSPDGQWVLGKTAQAGRNQLVLIPTGAGQAKPLPFQGLEVGFGGFTPDGRRIVFDAVSSDGSGRLYVADLTGGKPQPLGKPGLGFQPFGTPVSQDGRRAVAIRGGNFVVLPLDGSGEPRELAGLVSPRDRVPQWSEDSRSLYVYSQGTRPLQVDLYDVEAGRRRPWRQISMEESAGQVRLRITPDGGAYAYRMQSVFSELYLVDGLR